MKFTINSATKDIFGTYEIAVTINGKPYNYELYSKYAYDLMMREYRLGNYGKVINILNHK